MVCEALAKHMIKAFGLEEQGLHHKTSTSLPMVIETLAPPNRGEVWTTCTASCKGDLLWKEG